MNVKVQDNKILNNTEELTIRKVCDQSGQFKSYFTLPANKKRIDEGGIRLNGKQKKQISNKPRVTVITAVYNGEKFIENTIVSIINQAYDNLEFIIIDGGSNDSTVDIIKKYENSIDYWVSEPDKGISDAFNKGVQLSTGDYINFQGDGDGFLENTSVAEVMKGINPESDIFISAGIVRTDIRGKTIFKVTPPKSFNKQTLLSRMSMPHQGLLTHKSYFEKYGLFDLNNIYCMDYEHLLRSYKVFPKVQTKQITLARWRDDGIGNNNTFKVLKEYSKIKRINNVASMPVLLALDTWMFMKFFIKTLLLRK